MRNIVVWVVALGCSCGVFTVQCSGQQQGGQQQEMEAGQGEVDVDNQFEPLEEALSADEKLYNMMFVASEKERSRAHQVHQAIQLLLPYTTTEEEDAVNGKRIRIQMYSRDIGEPSSSPAVASAGFQQQSDSGLDKRMRLQSMSKRIRLQSLRKRSDESSDGWSPLSTSKRMRLQSLKRSAAVADSSSSSSPSGPVEEKRMRLQSLKKRMRLQSMGKRMRLQSL